MIDSEFVNTKTEGNILVVEINRPEKMNALHPPANRDLGEIFDKFAADKDLWVAIITGAASHCLSQRSASQRLLVVCIAYRAKLASSAPWA